MFYRIMRALVYRELPPDVGDFRLISRPCLDAVRQMRETHRFLRGMVAWVGFPQVAVAYHRQQRVAGVTKYPLRKMLAFSWIAATSFSTLPLRLSMIMGAMVGMHWNRRGNPGSAGSLSGLVHGSGMDVADGAGVADRKRDC